MTRRAIYPGTFDPITYGHLDLIRRAARLFDELIVAVAPNPQKAPTFDVEERMALVEASLTDGGQKNGETVGPENPTNVRVLTFSGLLVDFVTEHQACTVVRGLRAISDFEFEFQMALINRQLQDAVETIFLPSKEEYTYVSSRIVKEIAKHGADRVRDLVPPSVLEALRRRFG